MALFRGIRELMLLKEIDGIATVELWHALMDLGLSGPHSLKRLKIKLLERRITLSDVESLLIKIPPSTLTGLNVQLYYMIMCFVHLHRDGSQERAYLCYLSAVKDDSLSISVLDHAFTLHLLGKYTESIDLVDNAVSNMDLLQDPVNQRSMHHLFALNFFYLGLGRRTLSHCVSFEPFRCVKGKLVSRSPWIDNAIFGVYVLVLILRNQLSEAKQLLMEGMNDEHFIPNSIIEYCSTELGWKLCLETTNCNYLELADCHVDIFSYYRGMILMRHQKDFEGAILMFLRCNFYGSHPDHYRQLSVCFEAIGLYDRAKRYLKRAMIRFHSNVSWRRIGNPPIPKPCIAHHEACANYVLEHREKLESLERAIEELQCDRCGARNSSERCLYPCSGCLKVWYCSKRCQKIQWKKLHRERCDKKHIGFKQRLKAAKRSPFP